MNDLCFLLEPFVGACGQPEQILIAKFVGKVCGAIPVTRIAQLLVIAEKSADRLW